MASFSGRAVLVIAHGAALVWLLVLSPLELASALTGLVSRADRPGAVGIALAAARVGVVAMGLMLGRQLTQPHPGARTLAILWAVADLGTLAIVLATTALPSNRAPGDGPLVFLGYVAAAATVVAVAVMRR